MSRRVILVTGGNGGLGLAIAEAFLSEHPDNIVWLTVHTRREGAEKLRCQHPERIRLITLDVTNPDDWKRATAEIVEKDQSIHVLVNNAGKHEDALLATMPRESWDRVLSANLDAVFHGCQAVMQTMISQRSGRIINISSLSALLAPPGQANYAAAKAGVVALTQSLAKEVARIGITVNAICPGYVETDALQSMSPEEKKAAASRIPMRRFGKPHEIAAAVRFLACPEASYITGSVLKIDGGIF